MRILYLMHVDWNWIWQRPHAFAEKLAENNIIKVMYRLNPNWRQLTRNEAPVDRAPIIPVPKRWFPTIALAVQRAQVSRIINRLQPDIIWITHPDLWEIVSKIYTGGPKIIYDRMDLPEGFSCNTRDRDFVTGAELDLILHSSMVLCSSLALFEDARSRYPNSNSILVRNALRDDWINVTGLGQHRPSKDSTVNVWYFGTLSHWIDWQILLECLNARSTLVFHLVGPCEGRPQPFHSRLKLYPPVPHYKIPEFTVGADAYILPFRLNELTLAVNPVKLYEYISLNRPIFCVNYPEAHGFTPFIRLYRSTFDLLHLIDSLQSGELIYDPYEQERLEFLRANTWSARYNTVMTEIEGVLSPTPSS